MLPCRPAPELVLMMRASSLSPALARSRQCAAAWRATQKCPFRCTRTTASHSSSEVLTNMRSRTKPALLTTTSSRPNASSAACDDAARPPPSRRRRRRWRRPRRPRRGSPRRPRAAGPGRLPAAVERAAEVVDHDLGALGREGERMGAADAAAGAGDDDDATVADAGCGRRTVAAIAQRRSMMVTLAWPPPSHIVCRP